ncbi:MAG: hypothetical protein HEP71_13895 [Roseivirga sp.]|nr:hypothetical protein [Roseivirga sp.]
MKYKKAIWIFFATIIGIQIVFWLSPLQFKYSIYSFEINAVAILLFSISLTFLFKPLRARILAPILSLVVLGGIWSVLLFTTAFGCGEYDVNSIEIDKYMIHKGVIGCWAGSSTHSFIQLERKLVGDFITYIVERNEIKNSERNYEDQPRFNCDITFEKSNLTFDQCNRVLKEREDNG